MRHAVSSANRGSRKENVRGAKLTEKRTRGAPCSFKCKQGLQGRKRPGRQIDGENDERGAMQFQVQAGAPRKKRERKREGRKEEKKGIRKKKGKKEGARKKKERKLNQYDERGAMQFQVQAGAPGKKTSGAPN